MDTGAKSRCYRFVFYHVVDRFAVLGNFVGEYMSLVGIFASSKIAAGTLCLGIVLSAVYYLRLMQKIFFGPSSSVCWCKRTECISEHALWRNY